MNHIELFAGCGGLSLGLEQAGFELVFANELSPMAAETFAYNFLGENFSELAQKGKKQSTAFWLSSRYQDLQSRLRENPFEYPDINDGESDLPADPFELNGKLIVGNIIHLNRVLQKNKNLLKSVKSAFGQGEVDLVSGGPPCQSFSLAGLRKKDCDKNVLPWEFATFVKLVQPKIAVLENVTGILRAFKEDGVEYHAWFEVAKAFAENGYVPLCLHINARLAGVPQNRPRFIMIAVRTDFFLNLKKTFNVTENTLFSQPKEFFDKVKKRKAVSLDDLSYFDAHNAFDFKLLKDSFLSPLVSGQIVSVKEAIDDLRFVNPSKKSDFVKKLNKHFSRFDKGVKRPENHEKRNNNPLVQRRFRIYQVIQACSKSTKKEVLDVMKKGNSEITDTAWSELKEYEYLSADGGFVRYKKQADFIKYLLDHLTKKLTQKALDPDTPASAALSIPDDACHYAADELRTLTVREMARIQSFPDGFVFRSKVTTGGQMRKFEVPQYTQVGNAVPPLLGFTLGEAVCNLLRR